MAYVFADLCVRHPRHHTVANLLGLLRHLSRYCVLGPVHYSIVVDAFFLALFVSVAGDVAGPSGRWAGPGARAARGGRARARATHPWRVAPPPLRARAHAPSSSPRLAVPCLPPDRAPAVPPRDLPPSDLCGGARLVLAGGAALCAPAERELLWRAGEEGAMWRALRFLNIPRALCHDLMRARSSRALLSCAPIRDGAGRAGAVMPHTRQAERQGGGAAGRWKGRAGRASVQRGGGVPRRRGVAMHLLGLLPRLSPPLSATPSAAPAATGLRDGGPSPVHERE